MKNPLNTFNKDFLPAMALGITVTIGYGTVYYAYSILLPYMAKDLGISLSKAFGFLSIGMLIGGLILPVLGYIVDRFGGKWLMTIGAVLSGLTLMPLAFVTNNYELLGAIILAEIFGLSILYSVAFPSVARLKLSVTPKESISVITLFGGVASAIFWPSTLALYQNIGWANTWLLWGVVLIVICAPLNFYALNRPEHDIQSNAKKQSLSYALVAKKDRKKALINMVISFIFAGYVMGALMTLWVTNIQDLGHTAVIAAIAGTMIGPFKTIGRFMEMLISKNLYPLVTYHLSVVLMVAGLVAVLTLGFTVWGVLLAAALYGMGDGIKTIANGTLPLALFGGEGYGKMLGWVNLAIGVFKSSSPFVFAWITETYGGWWSFATMGACLTIAGVFALRIPDPRKHFSTTFQ